MEDISPSIAEFVQLCKTATDNDTKVLKLVKKRFKRTDVNYLSSPEFMTSLRSATKRIKADRSNIFVHLKKFLDNLKSHDAEKEEKSDSKKRPKDSDSDPSPPKSKRSKVEEAKPDSTVFNSSHIIAGGVQPGEVPPSASNTEVCSTLQNDGPVTVVVLGKGPPSKNPSSSIKILTLTSSHIVNNVESLMHGEESAKCSKTGSSTRKISPEKLTDQVEKKGTPVEEEKETEKVKSDSSRMKNVSEKKSGLQKMKLETIVKKIPQKIADLQKTKIESSKRKIVPVKIADLENITSAQKETVAETDDGSDENDVPTCIEIDSESEQADSETKDTETIAVFTELVNSNEVDVNKDNVVVISTEESESTAASSTKSGQDEEVEEEEEAEEEAENEETNEEAESSGGRKCSRRQQERLEHLLEKLSKEIKKIEQRELSLDDLEQEDSTYTYEDRLKKKFVKAWNKYCKVMGRPPTTGRTVERKFKFQGSRYPEINKLVEKFITVNRVFPDFNDIRDIINLSNSKYKLHIPAKSRESLARDVFLSVGNELQRRRLEDFSDNIWSTMDEPPKLSADPALYNPELRAKFDQSKKIFKTKMDQVYEKYSRRQEIYSESSDDEDDDDENEEPEEDVHRKGESDFDLDELEDKEASATEGEETQDNANQGSEQEEAEIILTEKSEYQYIPLSSEEEVEQGEGEVEKEEENGEQAELVEDEEEKGSEEEDEGQQVDDEEQVEDEDEVTLENDWISALQITNVCSHFGLQSPPSKNIKDTFLVVPMEKPTVVMENLEKPSDDQENILFSEALEMNHGGVNFFEDDSENGKVDLIYASSSEGAPNRCGSASSAGGFNCIPLNLDQDGEMSVGVEKDDSNSKTGSEERGDVESDENEGCMDEVEDTEADVQAVAIEKGDVQSEKTAVQYIPLDVDQEKKAPEKDVNYVALSPDSNSPQSTDAHDDGKASVPDENGPTQNVEEVQNEDYVEDNASDTNTNAQISLKVPNVNKKGENKRFIFLFTDKSLPKKGTSVNKIDSQNGDGKEIAVEVGNGEILRNNESKTDAKTPSPKQVSKSPEEEQRSGNEKEISKRSTPSPGKNLGNQKLAGKSTKPKGNQKGKSPKESSLGESPRKAAKEKESGTTSVKVSTPEKVKNSARRTSVICIDDDQSNNESSDIIDLTSPKTSAHRKTTASDHLKLMLANVSDRDSWEGQVISNALQSVLAKRPSAENALKSDSTNSNTSRGHQGVGPVKVATASTKTLTQVQAKKPGAATLITHSGGPQVTSAKAASFSRNLPQEQAKKQGPITEPPPARKAVKRSLDIDLDSAAFADGLMNKTRITSTPFVRPRTQGPGQNRRVVQYSKVSSTVSALQTELHSQCKAKPVTPAQRPSNSHQGKTSSLVSSSTKSLAVVKGVNPKKQARHPELSRVIGSMVVKSVGLNPQKPDTASATKLAPQSGPKVFGDPKNGLPPEVNLAISNALLNINQLQARGATTQRNNPGNMNNKQIVQNNRIATSVPANRRKVPPKQPPGVRITLSDPVTGKTNEFTASTCAIKFPQNQFKVTSQALKQSSSVRHGVTVNTVLGSQVMKQSRERPVLSKALSSPAKDAQANFDNNATIMLKTMLNRARQRPRQRTVQTSKQNVSTKKIETVVLSDSD